MVGAHQINPSFFLSLLMCDCQQEDELRLGSQHFKIIKTGLVLKIEPSYYRKTVFDQFF
jgi:hypothetical protein